MNKKLILGCPVKNRAWVLPRWFNSIYEQDYEDLEVQIICLLSKSDDETASILKQGGATIILDPYPGRSSIDIDGHHWGRIEDYAYMAELRNTLMECVIANDADYFFSLDSDVLCPPDAFSQLIEILKRTTGVVSPAVNMAQAGEVNYNTMCWVDQQYPGTAHRPFIPPQGGYVDVLMAAMLLDRKGMEARWQAHHQGEDLGFCLDARAKQIPLWWEPSIRCDHLMHR